MARTNAASASFQTQNLRGFAHALHRPALQRLLNAEPLLRRAVPILIVAFIAAVAVGAVVQITEHRRETIVDAGKELALLSLVLGEDLSRRAGDDTARPGRRRRCARRCPRTRPRAGGGFTSPRPAGASSPRRRRARYPRRCSTCSARARR